MCDGVLHHGRLAQHTAVCAPQGLASAKATTASMVAICGMTRSERKLKIVFVFNVLGTAVKKRYGEYKEKIVGFMWLRLDAVIFGCFYAVLA